MKVTRKKLVELLHVLLNIDDIEIIKCAIESLLDDLEQDKSQDDDTPI